MNKRLLFILFLILSSVILSANEIIDKSKLNKDIKVPFTEWKTNKFGFQEELPSDFPVLKIDSVNNPTPGHIVMECFQVSNGDANYIMITDEKGKVEYYSKPENQGVDFKMQPNGRFSYASRVKMGDKYQAGPLTVQNIMVQHNILDKNYNIIDTVQMQNELLADMHEFVILPNGNYLAVSYEGVPVDMSKLIPNGNPNAKIVGTVFQELDKDKKCVFQWRSLDYIPILATKDDPKKAIFEHVHGNSMFLDKDGNLIVSFPTTFEIVKIDMVSGEMLWRFGGDNNQFEITGDNEVDKPYYFRMQHDAHRLANGNLMFYDNGVQKKSGWSSRAVEYKFDEENRKAQLEWEYKHNPAISAFAMGSVQRLKNGNTLIDWGLIFVGTQKSITEVTKEKEIKYEMTLPPLTFSYRAHKYDLPPCKPVADIDKFEMMKGNTYKFSNETSDTGIELFFSELDGFIYNTVNIKKYDCAPLDPVFEGEAPVILQCRYEVTPIMINSLKSELRFKLNTLPPYTNPENLIVYYRPKFNSGIFKSLTTTYDVSENTIVANADEFGEFIIGFVRKAIEIMPPTLQYPMNKKDLVNNMPVKFVWSSTARYDKFTIQVASDPNFDNIDYDSMNVQIPIITVNSLVPSKKYYWRSRTYYRDLVSDWSDVSEFTLSHINIGMVFPLGGESLSIDSTYVIRWNTNMTDSVKIELFLADDMKKVISTGIYSYYSGFQWKIPKDLAKDTKYKIRVTNILNNSIFAESGMFAINPAVGVEDNIISEENFEISPNPVNDFVNIKFTTENYSNTKISIVNMLGVTEKLIFDSFVNENNLLNISINTSDLSPGVYNILLQSGNKSNVRKIVVLR
jgi:hypothetical protein